ncbi:MAG: DNA (cytosine-5)-methyltransferase 1 [Cocleimonas sp.]|jgi:DNA (cytosine-5)-methyltransferase 1
MHSQPIQIIDLFAGPGGLGEGFSSYRNNQEFNIIVSAEKDENAHKTLRLRAFYRILKKENPKGLEDYYKYCNGETDKPYSDKTLGQWELSSEEAKQITLGSPEGNAELDQIIEDNLDSNKPWVLIGGPPCQAYSLVGRARNKGNSEYKAEEDHRNFLYKEYLRIIQQYHPTIFVMENVKGILSSTVSGRRVFHDILNDLTAPDIALDDKKSGHKYRICSLVSDQVFKHGDDPHNIDPKKFVIKSEEYGIPQARHRVILVGIREDKIGQLKQLEKQPMVTVEQTIGKLPELRSKLSKGGDSPERWRESVVSQLTKLSQVTKNKDFAKELAFYAQSITNNSSTGSLRVPKKVEGKTENPVLDKWLLDKKLKVWLNSETRGHMDSDLGRYGYAATFAQINKRSPKGHKEFDLPGLRPEHKNWETGKFSDRFRVQLSHLPSTTVTSHISKDGHYFIHYDPTQCRSLTVREAARLQTFPDNYFFQGNRTQQFHQVGNAVPPLLAYKIANNVAKFFNESQ